MREQLNYSCQVLSMIPVKLLLDPESFSTAINGTLYIWIYWTRTSTFKFLSDSFSSFFQIYQINQNLSHHFQTLQICSCLEFGIFYSFHFPRNKFARLHHFLSLPENECHIQHSLSSFSGKQQYCEHCNLWHQTSQWCSTHQHILHRWGKNRITNHGPIESLY